VSVESVKQALAEADVKAPADSAARSPDGELATPTLAELYLKQGFPEKAADVYRAIVDRDPSNAEVTTRLAEIEATQARRNTRRQSIEAEIAKLERLLGAVRAARGA
jgi:predicted Zn-dependent protease